MSDYSRLIEIFEKLVGFHTVTGEHKTMAACLEYIEKILAPSGMIINRYSSNGHLSMVATTHATKKPRLMLQSHIDVVPGDKKMFSLLGQGEKLVGRGAFDMKFAAACYIRLVEELGPAALDFDFGIMLTTDEEVGGVNGCDYLLDQGYGCEVCILPDGGDAWRLESAAKGIWQFNIVAEGVSAHASRPWAGVNAAEKLLAYVAEAKKLAPMKSRADTTMVLSRLEAGTARNQVPKRAAAIYDVRYLNDAALQDIEKKVVALANKHDVYIDFQRRDASLELDLTLPAIQEWERVVSEVRGVPPAGYGLSFGASDARFFADHNIPTIVTRPGGGGPHGDDEWISEAEFYEFYECVKRYTMELGAAQSHVIDAI